MSQAPALLRGTLRYRPLPPVMSVESYLGVEFSLLLPSGGSIALRPGAAFSAQLEALDGREVTLRVRQEPPPPSSPFEAAPLGPDGRPLGRPVFHEVLEVLP